MHLFANTHIYSNIYNIASNIAHFHSTIVHLKYFFMEKSNKKKSQLQPFLKKKIAILKFQLFNKINHVFLTSYICSIQKKSIFAVRNAAKLFFRFLNEIFFNYLDLKLKYIYIPWFAHTYELPFNLTCE